MDELFQLHQGTVFLRREAIEHGYDDRDLIAAVRRRSIVRIRHGAYMDANLHDALDELALHAVRARAVLLSHPGRIAFSHTTGAVLRGLRVWGADLTRIHVVRLDQQTSRRPRDVVHHVGGWAEFGHSDVDGLPVLEPIASAMGLASVSSIESGLVTLDSLFDDVGEATLDLESVFTRMGCWPGTRRLQVVARLAQPGSESVGESRLRYLCWRGHVPKPILQYEVRDPRGHVIGYVDMAWPDHHLLGEFDGKVKFGRYLRPGETAGDAAFREKVREDRIREATGWSFIRFTWADLDQPSATLARLSRQMRRRTA